MGNDVYTILNVYICSCVLFVDACIVLCFVDGINCYDQCVALSAFGLSTYVQVQLSLFVFCDVFCVFL